MVLPDVDVLVYAHREDAPKHDVHRTWLEGIVGGDEAYGRSELVLSGFLRVVTHPRVFKQPSALSDALAFAEQLRSQPNYAPVHPGPRHWAIFTRLCGRARAKGNLVPDAYLAALAIESGCEWITTDRDFGRFPGLRCRSPLDRALGKPSPFPATRHIRRAVRDLRRAPGRGHVSAPTHGRARRLAEGERRGAFTVREPL